MTYRIKLHSENESVLMWETFSSKKKAKDWCDRWNNVSPNVKAVAGKMAGNKFIPV